MKPTQREIEYTKNIIAKICAKVPVHLVIALAASHADWHTIVSSDDQGVHGIVVGIPEFVKRYMEDYIAYGKTQGSRDGHEEENGAQAQEDHAGQEQEQQEEIREDR